MKRRPTTERHGSHHRAIRLYLLVALGFAFAGAVVFRLVSIQIFSSYRYQSLWRTQTERRLLLPATRGDILDRNHERLAYNVERPIDMAFLQTVHEPSETSIAPEISHKGQVRYRKTKRVYPYGELAGQVVGFVGHDAYGLAGIEYAFDDLLRGMQGWAMIARDAKRRKYPLQGIPKVMPEPGCHVRLTLDAKLQAIVEKALQRGVQKTQSSRGMAMVMEPNTGEILAMASYPFFNPNRLEEYTSRDWKNLCVSYTYEPGSTFKVVTASAALQENMMDENTLIDGSQGVFTIYDEEIHDTRPYGLLTFAKAVAYSSNVCFAKIAGDLHTHNLYRYARAFGFGVNSAVQLPGEESGVLHPVNLWSGRTLVTMAIGYEISTTLLQTACAFAAVANGGILMKPQIVKNISARNGKTVRTFRPTAVRRVLSEQTAHRICSLLEEAVEYGTGKAARIAGLRIAGKTGTAEKIDEEERVYQKDRVMASFVGFVPADHPQLLCAVTLDEPQINRLGGTAAAPVFREIISFALHAPQLTYAEKIVEVLPNLSQEPTCFRVPNFVGMDVESARYLARVEGIHMRVMGQGSTVMAQIPTHGLLVPYSHHVAIMTEQDDESLFMVTVPSVIGKSSREALQQLTYLGLHVTVHGSGKVVHQSVVPGTKTDRGTTCVIECQLES